MPAVKSLSGKPPPTDLPIIAFASAAAFEAFLERQQAKPAPDAGVYVKFPKKGPDSSDAVASITPAEATAAALCYGWIDGWGRGGIVDDDGDNDGGSGKKKHDNGSDSDSDKNEDEDNSSGSGSGKRPVEWHIRRFTPRRPRTSAWSLINVAAAERLIADGRMRPAGLREIEAARADGRWARAYPAGRDMRPPPELEAALAAPENAAAAALYNSLGRSDAYHLLMKVYSAASPSAASNRIRSLVAELNAGRLPIAPSAMSKTAARLHGGGAKAAAQPYGGGGKTKVLKKSADDSKGEADDDSDDADGLESDRGASESVDLKAAAGPGKRKSGAAGANGDKKRAKPAPRAKAGPTKTLKGASTASKAPQPDRPRREGLRSSSRGG